MKKKYQMLGMIGLVICSVIYEYQKPEVLQKEVQTASYVILEGEFLKQGKYEYSGKKSIQDVIDEVGVTNQANLNAVNLELELIDESRLYLPCKKEETISLNQATLEELMTLKGVGAKTAQKIIDYRQNQPFNRLEDLMNVSGIGEKTYLRLRESLCL